MRSFRDIISKLYFLKVQYGKIRHKDEHMQYSENLLVADSKSQKI